MNFQFLQFKPLESGALLLTIHRPNALNALNEELLQELKQAFLSLQQESKYSVILLTGEGKAFVAGADIAKMKEFNSNQAKVFSKLGQDVFSTIENSSLVSIALINGFALGGGLELALACDLRIGSTNAKLGLPEVSLGLIPGFGGTQRLSRLIGQAKALEIILTGDMYTAEESYKMGILNHVVSPDELISKGESLARSILSRGKIAIQTAKKVLKEGYDTSLPDGMNLEAEAFSKLFEGEESKEGLAAFLEKRKPVFPN